jgi:hypothetical protein
MIASSKAKTAEVLIPRRSIEVDRSGPHGRNVEPMWMEFFFVGSTLQDEATLLCTDGIILNEVETVSVESSLQDEARPQLVHKST